MGPVIFLTLVPHIREKLLRWRPGAVTLVYPLGMKPCGYGQMVCLEHIYKDLLLHASRCRVGC